MIKIIKTLNLNRETTAILENAYSIGYEKQSNAIWQASFSLPINDPKVKKVELLKYVEIDDVGLFRIIPKSTSSTSNSVTFQCEHVLATLLGSTLFKRHQTTNNTTRETLEYLLSKQRHKHWRLGTVAFTRYFDYAWENENLLSAIFSVPKPFDKQYRWTWDTTSYPWTLNLVEAETAPTCRIKEGYNLIGFEIEENPMSKFNRIYPLGSGEGVNQLGIESVNNGIPYIEDIAPGEEIVERVWADRRFDDAAMLKANAEALLKKWKKPIITWKASAADVSSITGLEIDKLQEGKILRLDLDDYPVVELRIMKESRRDITGDPGNVQLEIGNVTEDLGTTQMDLERRQQINELYSMGATNILAFSYQDNCDSKIPALIPFYIDEDVENVNTCELTFRTKKFRAYSAVTSFAAQIVQAITSGGGGGIVKSITSGSGGQTVKSGTSGAGGGFSTTTEADGIPPVSVFTDMPHSFDGLILPYEEHTHEVPTQPFQHTHGVSRPHHKHSFEFTLEAHTHPVTIQLEHHTHPISITIPGHEHDIVHGIYLLSDNATDVQIFVDGNPVNFSGTSTDRLDLTAYMEKDSNGKVIRGRHEIELYPNERARIEADVILRVFIKSHLGGKL